MITKLKNMDFDYGDDQGSVVSFVVQLHGDRL